MSLYYCWVTKMANAVVLWVLVYFCVTSVNTKDTETFIYNVCSLNVEFKFIVHDDAEIMFLITQLDQYMQWCIYCEGLSNILKVHLPFFGPVCECCCIRIGFYLS